MIIASHESKLQRFHPPASVSGTNLRSLPHVLGILLDTSATPIKPLLCLVVALRSSRKDNDSTNAIACMVTRHNTPGLFAPRLPKETSNATMFRDPPMLCFCLRAGSERRQARSVSWLLVLVASVVLDCYVVSCPFVAGLRSIWRV